jgi:hypothetical protein
VGVRKRDLMLLVSVCLSACQGSNDTVLQPDTAAGSGGTPAAGMGGGMAGTSSSVTAGSAGTAGTAAKPPAAASGTGGGGAQASAAGTSGAAGKAGTSGAAGMAGAAGAAGVGVVAGAAGAAGEAGAAGTAGTGGAGEGGAGAGGEGAMVGAADPECDFTGIWIAKQATVSEAIGIAATSNNWYYLEFKQSGTNVEVSKHYDCGIEVTGAVTVTVNRATTEALIQHNVQTGRKATLAKDGTNCKFESERFWSIRGADEMRFLPDGLRNSEKSIDSIARENPLPTKDNTDGAIDMENDGKLGVAFQATGILSGTRNSVQRDWTKWFTEPGFEIKASTNWNELKIRADFDNEENIIDAPDLLQSGSTPRTNAKHTLRLRFLGRDASDPRVAQVVKGTQLETCYAIQDAIPAETLE